MANIKTFIVEGRDCDEEFKLERCHGGCSNGCTGLANSVHCPICPVEKFKPTLMKRTLQHLRSHFYGPRGPVRVRGYIVTVCPLDCKYGISKKGHYHCPLCNQVFRKRQHIEKHVEKCGNAPKSTTSAPSMSPTSVASRTPPPVPRSATTLMSTPVSTVHPVDSLPYTPIVSPNAEEQVPSGMPTDNLHSPEVQSPTIMPAEDLHPTPMHEGSPEVLAEVQSMPAYDLQSPGETATHNSDDELQPSPVAEIPSNLRRCDICGKYYNKKFLQIHIKRQHTEKPTDTPIHYTVCIDADNGVYCSSRNYKGPQHPIHVVMKTAGEKRWVECALDSCNDETETEARSMHPGHLCKHLRSVQHFSSVQGERYSLDEESLTRMTDAGFLSRERKRLIEKLDESARQERVPLIVEIPPKPFTTKRYRWFSVYSGTDIPHYWCRFKRTIVTSNSKKKTLTCPCTTKACVHRSIVRWLLYSTSDQAPDILLLSY